MLMQQQTISPLGCLMLAVLVILFLPVLIVLAVAFMAYILICRLFGVRRRPAAWQNYYRNFRTPGGASPRRERDAVDAMESQPFRGGTPPPASEDIIDVEVIEVEERSETERQRKE